MGGMDLRFYRCKAALLCVVLAMSHIRPVVPTFSQDFIDQKSLQMNMIVELASRNDANKCELLTSCGFILRDCSREACKPSLEEVVQNGVSTEGPFIYVSNNTDCPGVESTNGTCHFMQFDFMRSFIRCVCTREAGYKVSSPVDFTRVFFGSVTGTWRVFPGSDEGDCGGFETRVRNWYMTSTSVPKAVMVLIDVGASMVNKDKFGGDIFLETAKKATWELLRTLSPGDSVNIIAFNCVNATQFVFPPVTAQERPSRNRNYPEYAEFQAKLGELKADQVHFEASNITSAIIMAQENFDYIKRPDALKVIVVLTDGKFAEESVILPTASLAAATKKLFVYDVSPTAKTLAASFTADLSKIGGSFINIFRDVRNPLYAMESVYTFTATLHHRLMHPLADFTYKLDDFSRFSETILLASKPAFSTDGRLLGVAGISIYLRMVKDNLDEIRTIVNQQQAARRFDARTLVLGPANCTIQVQPKSVYVCGSNSTLPPNGGFCQHRDSGTSIRDRTCNHPTCKLEPSPGPGGKGRKLSRGLFIGLSVAAGVVVVVILIVLAKFAPRPPGLHMLWEQVHRIRDPIRDPMDIPPPDEPIRNQL